MYQVPHQYTNYGIGYHIGTLIIGSNTTLTD